MAETVGAHILQRLHEHGVRLVYGYPARGAIIRQSLKGKLQELVNRRVAA